MLAATKQSYCRNLRSGERQRLLRRMVWQITPDHPSRNDSFLQKESRVVLLCKSR